MNAIRNKIKSNSGASITFALLLFLVCAVISSVVIIASTAAGGRVSKMAEMDQRYYAVNSAAELLRDVLEGQTVVVQKVTTLTGFVDETNQTVDGTTGAPTTLTTPIPEYDAYQDVGTGIPQPSDASILVRAAKSLSRWKDEDGDSVFDDGFPTDGRLTGIELTSDVEALMACKVNVDVRLNADSGTLEFDIYNAEGTTGTTYKVRTEFLMDKSDSPGLSEKYGAPMPVAGKTIRSFERTETVKTMIRWRMADIEVVAGTGG